MYKPDAAGAQGCETKTPQVPEKGVMWFQRFQGARKPPEDWGRA